MAPLLALKLFSKFLMQAAFLILVLLVTISPLSSEQYPSVVTNSDPKTQETKLSCRHYILCAATLAKPIGSAHTAGEKSKQPSTEEGGMQVLEKSSKVCSNWQGKCKAPSAFHNTGNISL